MVVNRILNSTTKEFFELLEKAIIDDVQSSTNKTIAKVKEGFKYKKTLSNKMKNSGVVNVTIKKFDKESIYETHFSNDVTTNVVTYKVKQLNESQIDIVYEEYEIDTKTLNKINNSIMSVFYIRKAKKRINQLFDSMQSVLDLKEVSNG